MSNKPLTFGSLFAGIGGFDLGFERAGMVCKWQVEINDYCQRVLAKHWPDVRRHDDVRTFPHGAADEWRVDVICGGFPCQDISNAGERAGIFGERSGLFFELMRVVRTLGPRIVVLENTAALLDRGMGAVLGELAASGFDAEWSVLPACALGASHTRPRVFIVAYSHNQTGFAETWLHAHRAQRHDTSRRRIDSQIRGEQAWTDDGLPEPLVPRLADGIPDRMERSAALGNAVVPQVAEYIGRRIVDSTTT